MTEISHTTAMLRSCDYKQKLFNNYFHIANKDKVNDNKLVNNLRTGGTSVIDGYVIFQ